MLRYIEGWDYLPTIPVSPGSTTSLTRLMSALGWYSLNTYQVGVPATGRFGGKCLGFGSQNTVSGDSDRGRGWLAIPGGEIDNGYMGCALTVGNNSDFILYFGDASMIPSSEDDPIYSPLFYVRVTLLGQVQVYQRTGSFSGLNYTRIATSGVKTVFQENDFYLEVGWGDDGVEVRINTVTVISLPAAIFNNIDTLGFGRTVSGGGCKFDDIYICDNTGSQNNYFLGNVRAQWLPLASNYSTQWTSYNGTTPNFTAASNSAVDDTTYVKNRIIDTGNKDLYNVTPMVNTPLIYGLAVKGAYRQDDATQGFVKNTILSGATSADGASFPTYTTYTFDIDIFETDPNTGSGWLYSAINSVKIGPKQA